MLHGSLENLRSQIASFTADDSAIYSASEDDWATQPCVLDFQLTAAPAIMKTKPLVDFLQPPQSESLYPIGLRLVLEEYFKPTSFVPQIYRSTRFTDTQSWRVGCSTNWARQLTANEISGRVPTARYIKLLTACRYNEVSMSSPLISSGSICPSMGVTTCFDDAMPKRSRTFAAYRLCLRWSSFLERSRRISSPRQTLASPQSSIFNRLQNSSFRK